MTTPEEHLMRARSQESGSQTGNGDHHRRNLSTVLWGATLVILGTLFLLDQVLTVDWNIVHNWWPVALITAGLFSRGHVLTAVGTWLLIAKLELFGLTYSTAWPVILMIIGLGIVADAVRGGQKKAHCASFGQRGGSR